MGDIKVIWNDTTMFAKNTYSVGEVIENVVDIYHELKGTVPNVYIDDGRTVIDFNKQKVSVDDIVSYYGYISLGFKKVHYFKNMHNPEIIKRVATIERGDILDIKGLGKLRVTSIFNDLERDGHLVYEEIGIYCERMK